MVGGNAKRKNNYRLRIIKTQGCDCNALFMQTQSITLSNTKFDKVQGKVYVELQGKKCQVKTKFNMNDIENIKKRFGLLK